jgi:bifunctional N-acetylglucosamine-1-phosphate-uridyltransferase/glucosamine-1-phosphate-acetyltransferase GlmU-like protein
VADGAIIGPNTHLIDASIGTAAIVPHSVVYEAEVAAREQVQPFSVLGSATR